MNRRSKNLTLAAIIMVVVAATAARGQKVPRGEKALPLCLKECMPICMRISEATPENCDYACYMGCFQLQGRGIIGVTQDLDPPPEPSR